MIRQTDGAGWSFPAPATEAALRIAGQWTAYGGTCPFLTFWEADGGSRLSRMEDTAFLALAAEGDREEALLFLSMLPEAHTVRTDGDSARRLAALYAQNGVPAVLKTGAVMRLDDAGHFPAHCSGNLVTDCSPREIYPLLTACFGETMAAFDGWYVDVSHRLRHGVCHIAAVREEECLVATAMTVAECDTAVLLGAVATHPDWRGQGLASACVGALAGQAQAVGKAVWICPKNPGAQRLYAKLGFAVCGEWGTVTRDKA